MFSAFTGAPLERKPKESWHFQDNLITGIFASQGYPGAHTGVILPYGLTDEQRDVILWTFEWGQHHGKREGTEDLQFKLKRLLNVS